MILLNWIVKRCLEESEEYWKIEWLLPLCAKAEEEPFDPATNAFADSQLQDFCCWFRARVRSIMKSSDSYSLRRIYLGKTFEHKNHQGGNHQPIWNQCSFLSEHLVSRFLWSLSSTCIFGTMCWLIPMRAVVVHFFVPSWKSGCSETVSSPQAASRFWQGSKSGHSISQLVTSAG